MITIEQVKEKLEKIYMDCNDKRVYEIQIQIGDLLKLMSEVKP